MTTEAKIKLKVVDADGHYMEPQDLRPYIEAKYREVAPHRIVKDDGAEDWGGRDWISEGSLNFGNVVFTRESEEHQKGLLAVSDSREADGVKRQKSMYGSLPPGAVESAARLGVMDEEGIDAAVMYPTGALTWIPDSDYHIAVNRALNDWLAEWCSEDSQRMLGATNVVAIHDVEAACDEVRRCYEQHNFRAVFLRDTLPNAEVKWWHDTYDPFWRTCEELGVAIGFHPFPGDSMFGSASLFDIIGPDSARMYMRTPFNHPVDGMHTIMGIITGGICERFPNLHFGMLESGGGWLVPFLERLDSRFEYMGHTLPHLTMTPSDYFRRNWWISFDPEETLLVPSAEWLGADRIIWGSDYPHPDAFYPGFVQMLDENISRLSEDDRAKIRGRNAVDFYRL